MSLLDGDIVRRNLSSELNFSKEHRDINAKRIGFVASEITKNRGIAICAPIAPYEAPSTPELRIDTTALTPDEAAQEVLVLLSRKGYI